MWTSTAVFSRNVRRRLFGRGWPQGPWQRAQRRSRRGVNQQPGYAAAEVLETRMLLSAIAWDGGAGTLNWNDAANWDTADNTTLPGADDDVTVAFQGVAAIEVSNNVTIHSLQTSNAVTISTGAFSISGDSQLNAQFTNAGGTVSITGAIVTGSGQFVNAAGKILNTTNSTVNVAVENDGIWEVRGIVSVNGDLTTGPGSAIRVLQVPNIINTTLTVADGFTNHGEIDLSSGGSQGSVGSATLNGLQGTLVNATDGKLRSLVTMSPAGGGSRSLNAVLDNQGLLQVDDQLNWRNESGQSANSGTIRVTGVDLTLNQTGTDPRFTNTGTIEVGSGTGFGINAGAVVQDGGQWLVDGTLTLNSSFTQTAGSTILGGGVIVSGTPLDIQGGSLTGNGTVIASVSNGGQVSPGLTPASPGSIDIHGNYLQTSAGAYAVELGTPADQLNVVGTVTLAGALDLNLISGFHPALNQTFVILNNDESDAIVGTFSGLAEGELVSAGGWQFEISYVGGSGNDVTLRSINQPPVANAGGAYTVVRGGTVQLDASGTTDPNQANTTLTYEWDFDGDNQFDDATGIAPAFSAAGIDALQTRTIAVRVTDAGGLTSVATTTVNIVAVALLPDPCNPANTVLAVGGTSANDTIVVTSTSAGSVTVQINADPVQTFALPDPSTGRVIVYGQNGDDTISMDGPIALEAHGGAGNDTITGGSGNDVLLGDSGNDILIGSAGHDVLVGGFGADRIVGSAGHDILIAGDVLNAVFCDYDNLRSHWLEAVAASGVNLTDGQEIADDLIDETLVDTETDQLTGSSGADLFIISLGDVITDLGNLKKLASLDDIETSQGDVVQVV